jgi:hypothetical protein
MLLPGEADDDLIQVPFVAHGEALADGSGWRIPGRI